VLNRTRISKLTEPGRHLDGGGLYLHIRPGGSRQWVLRLTVRNRRRDISLGPVDVVTLEEARETALRMRREAASGLDPVEERRKASTASPTFREAAEGYHRSHILTTSKNGKHQWQWIRTLELHAFPHFGDMTVDEITAADVMRALEPVWLKHPETAGRVKQRISTVMEWAIASGHRTAADPTTGIERTLPRRKRKVEHFRALPYAAIPALWTRLLAVEGIGAPAVRFLILTAARSGEVRGMTWNEIDGAVWSVPASRMKAGRPHRVPLSKPALGIIAAAGELRRSDLVFPGGREKPMSDMTLLQVLRRLDVPSTVHGLRSSFRDWCEETGVRRSVAEAALAHVVSDTTEAAYRRTDLLEARIPVMDAWADFVTGAVECIE